MARYRPRFFFSAGAFTCFWPANEETAETFGLETSNLPLSENTWRYADYLCAWWATHLDWANPSGPSRWSQSEFVEFYAKAEAFLEAVRAELGEDFVIAAELD